MIKTIVSTTTQVDEIVNAFEKEHKVFATQTHFAPPNTVVAIVFYREN
jgi:hypothetical protein